MQILIRRKREILARHKFGFLQGEICLNAVDFRKQATLFLLVFKRESQRGRAKKCSRMLKRFGRYEIQYHFQHDARRKAMSPRIFADIQRRGLESPFDRLPIVANSCNYAIRLVSRDMSESRHSVDHAELQAHQKDANGDGHLELHAVHLVQQIRPTCENKAPVLPKSLPTSPCVSSS
jgi:hypothetical protein